MCSHGSSNTRKNLNQHALDELITTSTSVTDWSMSLAASDVRQRSDTQQSNIPGDKDVMLALTPPGTSEATIRSGL